MSVFLTPEGKPFYGGTYFPPEPRYGMPSFRQLLLAIADRVAHPPPRAGIGRLSQRRRCLVHGSGGSAAHASR